MIRHRNIIHALVGLAVMVLICLLASCSEGQKAHQDHPDSPGEQHEEHRELVQLSAQEMVEFAIKVDTAGPGLVRQHSDLTGEIVIDPDRLAHIIPRFPHCKKSA